MSESSLRCYLKLVAEPAAFAVRSTASSLMFQCLSLPFFAERKVTSILVQSEFALK